MQLLAKCRQKKHFIDLYRDKCKTQVVGPALLAVGTATENSRMVYTHD